jgi:two-component system, chemotaxis family, sensor kinase CheA
MAMNEAIREFLLETHENLAQLDIDLITLEKEPTDTKTISSIFRTLHTVKGTAGFIGLTKLEAISHAAESLLSKLRSKQLLFNQEIATALLAVVDAIRQVLGFVEANETEGETNYSALIEQLDRLREGGGKAPQVIQPVTPAKVVTATSEPYLAIPPEVPVVSVEPPAVVPPVAPPPQIPVEKPTIVPQNPVEKSTTVAVAPEPSPIEPASEARSSAVSDSSLRVDVGLLDKLMTLVGELVLARNQIMQFSSSQEDAGFLGTVQRLNLLTTELQANVMKTRMQPIGNIWSKFPRVVRDLSVVCGKQVRFEMDGQETELDKTIIEAIKDPLTHMVRNAVDHGIETPDLRIAKGKPAEGRLFLHAFHEGGKVIIEITDDGNGIDPQRVRQKAIQAKLISNEQAGRMPDQELVNLIFLPGFSTTDKVTQFSGRGVGMDVVRTNIEKIGGTVDIESRLGRGTTIKMKIPLTLAIIPALTITSGGERFCIPQVNLLELVRLEGEQAIRGIEMIHGAPVYRLRGNLLPLVYLNEQLAIGGKNTNSDTNIVVLQADDRQFGLVVDAIHDTEEIVVKPLQKQFKGVAVFAGATIMGDGRVALILDVLGLAHRANVVSGARGRAFSDKNATTADESGHKRESLLLFSTKDNGRMAIPLSQVARLEEFPRSALERIGKRDVVQYRGEILNLLDLSLELRHLSDQTDRSKSRKTSRAKKHHSEELAQVVVYSHQGQRIGLVVGSILDIVDEEIISQSRANRPGVMFTAVVQGKVTEFLDIEEVVRKVAPEFTVPIPA